MSTSYDDRDVVACGHVGVPGTENVVLRLFLFRTPAPRVSMIGAVLDRKYRSIVNVRWHVSALDHKARGPAYPMPGITLQFLWFEIGLHW